jgi:hypothetical protein
MNNEKGQALPLAIMALAIGTLLIAPFLGHAGASIIGSRTYSDTIGYRNASDAGVEHAIWSLIKGGLGDSLPNPGDQITYQLPETINGATTTVTVTVNATGGSGTGNITKTVKDTLLFYTSTCFEPDMIQVSNNVCVIAYRGASNTGYLKTASIAANGDIGNSVISTLTLDTTCYTPSIIQVTSGIYAIAYRGASNRGNIKTVSILANGTIGSSVISTLIFDTTTCYEPDIVQVASNIYAIAYRGASTRGYLKTVSITAGGVIGGSAISTLIFDTSACNIPNIKQVTSSIYAIAYNGPSNDGYLKTVSVSANGTIGGSAISTLIFDTTCYEPDIVQVASNIFAIAYRGPSNDGYLKTESISANGTIGGSVISTLIFDTTTCYEPDIILATGNTYIIAYRNSSNLGYLKTVSIASNGTIAPAAIDTFNFETTNCVLPSILQMPGDIYAVAYRGPSNNGYLKTIGIPSHGGTATYRIVSTAGDTTIRAYVNTNNTTATIVAWWID